MDSEGERCKEQYEQHNIICFITAFICAVFVVLSAVGAVAYILDH